MIHFKQQSSWVLLFTCAFNQEEKESFGGGGEGKGLIGTAHR